MESNIFWEFKELQQECESECRGNKKPSSVIKKTILTLLYYSKKLLSVWPGMFSFFFSFSGFFSFLPFLTSPLFSFTFSFFQWYLYSEKLAGSLLHLRAIALDIVTNKWCHHNNKITKIPELDKIIELYEL